MPSLKTIRERFAGFFTRQDGPAPITEGSSLYDVTQQYAHAEEFIARKYGVKVTPEDRAMTLRKFVEKYGLPPAQIVYMEIQMSTRAKGVEELRPSEAKRLIEGRPGTQLLDVREGWEVQLCRIPGSRPLTTSLLDEILNTWAKDTPILLYCHHGVRSLDAASFLVDRGFTEVYALRGGIHAWSTDIDPTIRRYEGNWC